MKQKMNAIKDMIFSTYSLVHAAIAAQEDLITTSKSTSEPRAESCDDLVSIVSD